VLVRVLVRVPAQVPLQAGVRLWPQVLVRLWPRVLVQLRLQAQASPTSDGRRSSSRCRPSHR